jgi:hypothetical protein
MVWHNTGRTLQAACKSHEVLLVLGTLSMKFLAQGRCSLLGRWELVVEWALKILRVSWVWVV